MLNHDVAPSELFTVRRAARAAGRLARAHPNQIPALTKEVALALRNEIRRSRARRDVRVGGSTT